MLQRTNASTNIFNKNIKMLQRTQMLQRTRRNTIGRRSTRLRMTRERWFMLFMCVRLFLLFIGESLLIVLLRKDCLCFSYLYIQCIQVKLVLYYFYTYYLFCFIFFLF